MGVGPRPPAMVQDANQGFARRCLLALPGLVVRVSAGNPNWVRATIEAVATALIGTIVLPQLETVYWRLRRRGILLDERDRKSVV